jgi:hypothetical protein
LFPFPFLYSLSTLVLPSAKMHLPLPSRLSWCFSPWLGVNPGQAFWEQDRQVLGRQHSPKPLLFSHILFCHSASIPELVLAPQSHSKSPSLLSACI